MHFHLSVKKNHKIILENMIQPILVHHCRQYMCRPSNDRRLWQRAVDGLASVTTLGM